MIHALPREVNLQLVQTHQQTGYGGQFSPTWRTFNDKNNHKNNHNNENEAVGPDDLLLVG